MNSLMLYPFRTILYGFLNFPSHRNERNCPYLVQLSQMASEPLGTSTYSLKYRYRHEELLIRDIVISFPSGCCEYADATERILLSLPSTSMISGNLYRNLIPQIGQDILRSSSFFGRRSLCGGSLLGHATIVVLSFKYPLQLLYYHTKSKARRSKIPNTLVHSVSLYWISQE